MHLTFVQILGLVLLAWAIGMLMTWALFRGADKVEQAMLAADENLVHDFDQACALTEEVR